MQLTPYKIYSASAGSGKTFTLVKAYLSIILSPGFNNNFRQLLAITFTNKAVNEMKQRILENLYDFSRTDDATSASTLFKLLQNELDISLEELRTKSEKTLKQILHNYAFFDVSTIDKFTHRIIRTFAKDLKLPQNFEVVLDTDILLDEAVNRLLSNAGSDKKLTSILVDFALEKIDDSKSWDITFDLNNIGKLLFNENHYPHLKRIEDRNIDDFLELKKTLISEQLKLQSKAQAKAKQVLQFISECGLEHSDFPRATLPNHFKKISEGDYTLARLYNNKLEEQLVSGKILKSGFELPSDEIATVLLEKYRELKQQIYTIAFYKNAYGNSVPLTILNAIYQELQGLEKERDLLPISSFNRIISNEIKNQPAPFIYERLGEKYRHYFMDEFQDTSEMQWNNLIPLISNALESEDEQGQRGSLFLVGDAKQAIYRWRGGRAEQFLNLISLEAQPFAVKPEVYDLPVNFRSRPEIVAFNNAFFTSTGTYLNDSDYHTLFMEGNKQQSNSENGGFVQMSFLEENDNSTIDEAYCGKVLQVIEQSLNQSYDYRDICVLTRKRKHGILISDFLMQKNIPLVSSETLLLKRNNKVSFLLALLQHCVHPLDLENNYNILYFLSQDRENTHNFIHQNISSLSKIFREDYAFEIGFLKSASVYDGLEYAIKKFKLAEGSDAYISFLLDEVLQLELREDAGLSTFLNYWEKKQDQLSIVAPESLNAVRIMTIHKAKGLEFPVVIFPFSNTHIFEEINPKLWLPFQDQINSAFKEVLISKRKEVQNYSPEAASIFENEQHKLELDAFNLLYVALTRAIDALYIFTEMDLTSDGSHKPQYYSGLFIHYLKASGLWTDDKSRYTFGSPPSKTEIDISRNPELSIPYTYSSKNRPEFRILAKSGILWATERQEAISKGTALHQLMETVISKEDVEAILEKHQNVDIYKEEKQHYRTLMHSIIDHPQLKMFFEKESSVKNECDILTENGLILRPDRLVFKGDHVTILDYKTGKKHPKHREQIYAYADALEAMGYKVDKKVIIYINKEVTPEFI
ncbi:UvrD-helicase domain-containing protein [Muriicola sp. Z0-33]|uniref:UvrD-helicase domain-containing protein n=1 Tax=Muriicola sp. Z0-33 TaxID=2816957 RepID=UPI002238DD00|nr:UvrD-helicase domain-containing protein [Muriicola sp. Z0-33]MCW5514830.1 UvrD-helicase domain-containing protein [Muriicola sp. Z0-33]